MESSAAHPRSSARLEPPSESFSALHRDDVSALPKLPPPPLIHMPVLLRGGRNFLFPHPVIPQKWRNSLAAHHLRQNKVLEGDSYLLHVQAREEREREAGR